MRKFRAHPAELAHHAANRRSTLLLTPFWKRQLQIFRGGSAKSGTQQKQNRRGSRAHKACQRTRQCSNDFEQQPQCCVFEALFHLGIITGARKDRDS